MYHRMFRCFWVASQHPVQLAVVYPAPNFFKNSSDTSSDAPIESSDAPIESSDAPIIGVLYQQPTEGVPEVVNLSVGDCWTWNSKVKVRTQDMNLYTFRLSE